MRYKPISYLFALSFTSTLIMLITGMYLYFNHQNTNPPWYVNWSIANLVLLAACIVITVNPRTPAK